ncbi:Ankyrin repeat protein 3 [Giardia muris]|uniref:Ankyrin repeat protein 3 n=1 Tax=Giardia muris TaxID=5742 RepID=A0A4Z1SVF8_GIAMU|nr:Ankyrin repeat protein 3 [Giardia muris]|eukprot:TNJ27568.1 Ankyrin repeat protein 3 [Giardia muris]
MSSGSSLIDAARRGDADAVRAHLHEATQRDTRGWTALMHASARNFVECVEALIPYERGLADPQKITALMIAADNGHTEVVRLLAKEESRLQNSDGWTALMHASYRGFDECAELLLDEAGMQTTRRKDGMAPGSTALMVAARFSRPECIDLLRDREKGFVDSEGHDALWYAENKGVNLNVKTSEVYRDPRVLKLLEGTKDVHSDGGMGGVESGPAQTNIEADPIDPVPILPPQCQDDRNDSIPARPNEPRKQGRDAPVDDSRLRMLQETLSKKNQEIDQLKAVNIGMQAEIDERDGHIRILEDTLRENEKRHKELIDEVSALNEGNTTLEDHIGQLQQRLANTEEDRRLARNEASEARALAEQLQKQVEEGMDEQKMNAAIIDSLNNEVSSLQKKLVKINEEKDALHKQFENKERRDKACIDRLTAEVESLKKDLSSSKNAHNETKKELSQLNREVSSLKQQLQKANKETKKYREMYETLNWRVQEAEKSLAEARGENTSLKNQLIEMKSTIVAQDDKIYRICTENTSLQEQLSSSKKAQGEAEERLSQMSQEMSSLKAQLSKTKEEKNALHKQFEDKERQDKAQIDQLTAEVSSLKQQLDNAINESKRHAKMCEDLQKASDQNQPLVAYLEKENANRQARIEELVAEKTSLQEQLASSKKAQDGAEGELAQMNQEIDLLRQQLQKASEEAKKAQEVDQLNAEIIGLRGDVKDREEEIRDLQAQLEKSLNLRAQLEASQNTSKKKQRELDDYIAALRLENEELRREYNRMETKNVREAEASRKENQQLEVLNNELARLRKEGEDRENHYRAAIEELKRKHNVEITALRQRMEERDNMADERSQREKEFKNTALALERAMAEVASLRKENEELHMTSSVVTSRPREQPLESKNREVPTSTRVSGQPRTRGDQVAQCQASTGREELVEMVKTGMDREREGGQARTAISHQSRLSPIDLLSRDAQMRADNYRQRELTSQRPAAEYQQRYGVATSGSTVAQLMAELGYDKREEYSPNTTAGVARNLSEQTRRGEGVHQWTSSYLTEHKETSIGSRVSGRSPSAPSRTYQYGPSRDVQAQPQKVMVNSRQSVQPSPRVAASSRINTSRSPKTPESDKKEDVRRGYDTSRGRLDSSTGRSVTRDASALVGRGTLASSPYSPKMSGNASTGATARAFKTVSPVTYSSSSGVSTGARAESHISPSSRRSSLTGTRTNTTTGSSYRANARSPQITRRSRLTPTGIGAYSSGLNYRR